MSRIRTIKPDFWTSEQVVECSPTARLLFIGFWNFADDHGVLPASAKQLKMLVYPGDDFTVAHVQGLVDELLHQKLLSEFTADDGRAYWFVTGWHHQKIDKPSYKYPAPPHHLKNSANPRQPFGEHSANPRQPFGEASVTERRGEEGKGKEWKGEEEEVLTRSARESCATENPSSSPSSEVLDSSRDSRTEEANSTGPDDLLEAWNHVNPDRPVRALPPKRRQSVKAALEFVRGNIGKPDWPANPPDITHWFTDVFRYARGHSGYLRDRDFGFFMDADRLSGTVEGGYEPRH